MKPAPKIIAIDDKADDLEKIRSSLTDAGHACLPLKYPEARKKFKQFCGVRVVFMDIELVAETLGGAPARNFSAVVAILKHYLHEENGPYVLVVWTDNPDQYEDLVNYIMDNVPVALRPMVAGHVDKQAYMDGAGDLEKDIKTVLNSSLQVAALFDWEERVMSGAASAIGTVLNMVKLQSPFNKDQFNKELGNVMTRFAIQAVGKNNVKREKFRAFNQALLPMVDDYLRHAEPSQRSKGTWNKAINVGNKLTDLTTSEAAHINTKLQIISNTDGLAPSERGAAVKLPWKSSPAFKKRFGLTPSTARKLEFAVESNEANEWVLIQCQALCDFAQKQSGPKPFLLGLIVPDQAKKTVKENRKASLWVSPYLSLNGKTVQLHVNHRFVITLTETELQSAVVSFRMRDPLLDVVNHSYHSHNQRPGIIEF